MVELTFGGCKHSKRVTRVLPRFSSMKKGRWGAAFRNGSTKNFGLLSFQYLTKNVAIRMFCSSLFNFVPDKLHVDRKKHFFWDGINLSYWVYVGFLRTLIITATNPESSMSRVSTGYPKNIISEFSVESFLEARPKSPFSGIKILEDCTWLF